MSEKNNSPETTYNYILRGSMGTPTKEIKDTIQRIEKIVLKLDIFIQNDKDIKILCGVYGTKYEFVEFLKSLESKDLVLFNPKKNDNVASSPESMPTEEDLLRILKKEVSKVVFEELQYKTFLNLLESLKKPQITKYEKYPVAYKMFIILNILYDIGLGRNISFFREEYQDIIKFLK